MELTHRPLLRSRSADRSLTALGVLILVDVAFLTPLVEMGVVSRHLHGLVGALAVGLGAFAVWAHVTAARVLVVLAIAVALVRLANFAAPDASLRLWDALLALAGVSLLAYLVARQVFGARGHMNWHRVMGAVVIWLLAGMIFTQAYRLVAMHASVAFLVQGAAAGYDAIVASLNYFSFVTLATVGYGDIVPVHPVARGLALVEAVFGVMYPVVVISWLVSLEVEAGREQDPGKDP